MKKLALILILVLSISLITFKAFTGDWVPSEPPGPTMHSLNEIYDQIAKNAVPRYEYKYFGSIKDDETVTIHNGSGVVHSILFLWGRCDGMLKLIDDSNNTICRFDSFRNSDSYSPIVIPLDIGYKNSLKLYFDSGSWPSSTPDLDQITVVYKPDN